MHCVCRCEFMLYSISNNSAFLFLLLSLMVASCYYVITNDYRWYKLSLKADGPISINAKTI